MLVHGVDCMNNTAGPQLLEVKCPHSARDMTVATATANCNLYRNFNPETAYCRHLFLVKDFGKDCTVF